MNTNYNQNFKSLHIFFLMLGVCNLSISNL
jgi:hypothetical protein